jgi:hypothetical protein
VWSDAHQTCGCELKGSHGGAAVEDLATAGSKQKVCGSEVRRISASARREQQI